MKSCKNHGCNGLARAGQYFCIDCYRAWNDGGQDAVMERIAKLKDADKELEDLREFKRRIQLAICGPDTFHGRPVLRDTSDKAVFERIGTGLAVLRAADNACRAEIPDLPKFMVPRRKAVAAWLENMPARKRADADIRAKAAAALEERITVRTEQRDNLRGRVDELEREAISLRGTVCPCSRPSVAKHPSACDIKAQHRTDQLSRVEGKMDLILNKRSGPLYFLTGASLASLAIALGLNIWS
jgi:hypothetical protein